MGTDRIRKGINRRTTLLVAALCFGLWSGGWAAAADGGDPSSSGLSSAPTEASVQLIGKRARGYIDTPLGSLPYITQLEMEASGYYPGPESTGPWADGTTSAGLPAGYGVVAVDPQLIPLGTVLYIPGYGVAIAGDVGSAIKGRKIDLGFDSYREALFYGRRTVDVYVLEPSWLADAGDGVYPEPWQALAMQAAGEGAGR